LPSRSQILRSTSIIGGAAAINIAVGLVRTKIAALLLGPLGIGEIGLFLNLVQFVATIGALGLGTSAVRQIAEALGRGCLPDVAAARRALLWISMASAFIVGIIFALFAGSIGDLMSFSARQVALMPWLAVAVAATILSGVPIALLIGYRRIVDQALVQIGGAILGSIIGLACLVAWGTSGIIGYTIAAPITQLACGIIVVLRLPTIEQGATLSLVRHQARAMISLGVPFTVGALSMTGGLLALRALIGDRLGLLALGQFTAAWTLCVTYVGFILQAMGTDYFPRLSAAMSDPKQANRTVTEQLEISLLISLPIIVAVQAAAPWLIGLLYSNEFMGATTVIRWQILGDFIKISTTPIAYLMLAARRGKTYWIGETIAIIVLVLVTNMLINYIGLSSAGIAYIAMCVSYFTFCLMIGWKITGFLLARSSIILLSTAFVIILVTTICSIAAPHLGLVVGGVLSLATALYAARSLDLYRVAIKRFAWLERFIPHVMR
jgi:O-antigen/teichoic acid export membrane protein